MAFSDVLLGGARETVYSAEASIPKLKQQLSEIEQQKRDVEAKLDFAKLARSRLASFQIEISGHFQCPICWIIEGKRSNVRPISSGTSTDFFRCEYMSIFASSELVEQSP